MRYHVEVYNGKRLIDVAVFETFEEAKKFIEKEKTTQIDEIHRLIDTLFDIEIDDTIPNFRLNIFRYHYRITICNDDRCTACIESGLIK